MCRYSILLLMVDMPHSRIYMISTASGHPTELEGCIRDRYICPNKSAKYHQSTTATVPYLGQQNILHLWGACRDGRQMLQLAAHEHAAVLASQKHVKCMSGLYICQMIDHGETVVTLELMQALHLEGATTA